MIDRVLLPREGRGDGGVNLLDCSEGNTHGWDLLFISSYIILLLTTTTSKNDGWSSTNLLCVFNSAVCTFFTMEVRLVFYYYYCSAKCTLVERGNYTSKEIWTCGFTERTQNTVHVGKATHSVDRFEANKDWVSRLLAPLWSGAKITQILNHRRVVSKGLDEEPYVSTPATSIARFISSTHELLVSFSQSMRYSGATLPPDSWPERPYGKNIRGLGWLGL